MSFPACYVFMGCCCDVHFGCTTSLIASNDSQHYRDRGTSLSCVMLLAEVNGGCRSVCSEVYRLPAVQGSLFLRSLLSRLFKPHLFVVPLGARQLPCGSYQPTGNARIRRHCFEHRNTQTKICVYPIMCLESLLFRHYHSQGVVRCIKLTVYIASREC